MSTVEENLQKRNWFISNIDMVLSECYYHRENSIYYDGSKIIVWTWGQQQGCAKVTDETS